MFLAYVSPPGRALVGKGLYLPASWTSGPDRFPAAGVPEECKSYRSKTELALEMLERALQLGHLRAEWVAGDDAFGMSPSFRDGLAALVSRAAAKWITGAAEWWTTGKVPVGWAGRVGDRIRGWEPTGCLAG